MMVGFDPRRSARSARNAAARAFRVPLRYWYAFGDFARRARIPVIPNALVIVAAIAAWTLVAVSWRTCGLRGCPDPAELVAFQPAAAPVLLDRNGDTFARLLPLDRSVVALDSLPLHVVDAFVSIEDRRFFDHSGVDWRRVLGAAVRNLRSGEVDQGASTITMQLARNLFPEQLPARSRTLRRKFAEARVARAIEARFSKREILELYLNHIYFGDGAYGVDAAARNYFGHGAPALSIEEAATLAAMVRAPNYYDPRERPDAVRPRRDLVLSLMAREHRLDPESALRLAEKPIVVADHAAVRAGGLFAAYFIERVRTSLEERFGKQLYGTGLRVRTTLDPVAQHAAEEQLTDQIAAIEAGRYGRWRDPVPDTAGNELPAASGSPYLQGAVVVLEAATGDVLALVGGRDYAASRFDRAVTGRRQVGSAFKPFVYAAALRQGFAPSQPIDDAPYSVRLSRTRTWQPENYEGGYDGLMTMRYALAHSRNVPTVRLAQAVGLEAVIDLAHSAGIDQDLEPNPSLALGTPSISPLELTAAYTAFANLGTRVEPRFILALEDSLGTMIWRSDIDARPALDPAVAYILTDMLTDVVDRGTGTAVRSAGFWNVAAGKTGTTSDAKDVWFVGYTPGIVASVWLGFDNPKQILPRASGGTLAAPVWGRIMKNIAASRGDDGQWQPPQDVAFRYVDPASGMVLEQECLSRYGDGPQREVFLADRVPRSVCPRRTTTSGWLSRFFSRVFKRGNDPELSTYDYDPTPLNDRDEVLGAHILPGTVDPGISSAGSPSRRQR